MIKYSRKQVITEAFLFHRRVGRSIAGWSLVSEDTGGFEVALSDKQETLTFSSALSSVSSHCEWQSPGTERRGGGDKRWEFSVAKCD